MDDRRDPLPVPAIPAARSLAGRVALVTGGAVRIGGVIAESLAEAGAAVAIHCRHSVAAGERLAEQIVGRGGRAAVVCAELAEGESTIRRLFAEVAGQLGEVTLLVNNASVFAPGTLASTGDAELDATMAVNLRAPLQACREFQRRLPAQATGAIVNIVDWRGIRPVPGHLAYTLSKAGLVALTEILAAELAPRIRVNAVAPGAILPPPGQPDSYLASRVAHVPLARPGTPRDIADAVLFLARAEFITGQVLPVTGGQGL